jgi:hypothetical protein
MVCYGSQRESTEMKRLSAMLWRHILVLLVMLAAGVAAAQQPGGSPLPEPLGEAEEQRIAKEHKPKKHVEATFKVSDAHLTAALKFARDSQYAAAAQDLDLYTDLLVYADAYTRHLAHERRKERRQCLKLIEQRIFRQTRTLEAVDRELPVAYREVSDRAVMTAKRIRLRALDDLLGGGEMLKDPGADRPER